MIRSIATGSGSLAFRVAFVAALAWALLVLAASPGDSLLAGGFGADSGVHRHAGLVLAFLALLLAGSGSSIVFRRWPAFLGVGSGPTWPGVVLRLLGWTPVVAVALGAIFFGIQWCFGLAREDPAHSQYGLSAWLAGFFYALALTPVATVVWAWLRLRGRRTEGGA